jgi:hypothetical protein
MTHDHRPHRPTAPWRRASSLALVASLLLVGACSSDGDDASGASDPAAETTAAGADGETGGDSELPATVDPALVGTWTMPASGLFPPTPDVPGMSEPECEGAITLELRDDGSFAQRGNADCADALTGLGSSVTIDATGSYGTTGTTIQVADVESAGTISLGGPAEPGNYGLEEGEITYEVVEGTLTLGYSSSRMGQVTHVYQRA